MTPIYNDATEIQCLGNFLHSSAAQSEIDMGKISDDIGIDEEAALIETACSMADIAARRILALPANSICEHAIHVFAQAWQDNEYWSLVECAPYLAGADQRIRELVEDFVAANRRDPQPSEILVIHRDVRALDALTAPKG